MKKYILLLVALFATMSIQAQVVKVYKNGTLQKTYINTATDKYKVVFEKATDPNLVPSVFTVQAAEGTNPAKKVKFTKGNLQATYNGTGYTWSFAPNQWDYIGGKDNNGTGTETGNNTIASPQNGDVVDLFGWSTSLTNYGINTSNDNSDYKGSFVDWGEVPDFSGKGYSTLSSAEWTYLLSTRTVNGGTGEGKSYQRTTLTLSDGTSTVYGLLIVPDNYTGSLGDFTSWSDWQTMESDGVVFLPGSGSRAKSIFDRDADGGQYWSSTNYGSYFAYRMGFGRTIFFPSGTENRCYGYSVRLVSTVSE